MSLVQTRAAEQPAGGGITSSCGVAPPGRYVMRVLVEHSATALGASVRIECRVDGKVVGAQSFPLRAGFAVLDCPVELTSGGEIWVRATIDGPADDVRLWPPVSPMVTEAMERPAASSLMPLIHELRGWSERPDEYRWTVTQSRGPRWRMPRNAGELKERVFNELYRHVEHRPLPLAAAQLTRKALRVLAAPARRLARTVRGD
jgi:hypothetical protein